jgi:hypothetical protein
MSYRFEQIGLWQSTLASQSNGTFSRERERLRNAFYTFRENTEVLVARIAATFPNLTKHDISHLDALWETATLIAGDSYPMNPLEGFVFGGAILLHDAALCYEAYSGGIDAIRNTVAWKDAYAGEQLVTPNLSDEDKKLNADFSAIRTLHAKEAAKLVERDWTDPETKQSHFLIEDVLLRKHLGQLMGRIASSHHWDLELVQSEFGHQENSISPFPREWHIDPLKLACLLRCADAAHFDHERAPDFLHALLHRRGISLRHWQAQNRIARADIDVSDNDRSTLVFTSSRPFPMSDAAAWWIAYDATCLIDKEIRASNAILETHNKGDAVFRVKRVKGVESPELMSRYIKAEGWQPCSAELHISNVEGLVAAFGGEHLYGKASDMLAIALRELIQNARDAIHARRAVDKNFDGNVCVRLRKDQQGFVLLVQDDGIGMSRRVLTGPFLDFGSSFWTSSLVKQEFPGLLSSRFRSVGQFGIGFYSVFMVAQRVQVASRRWDDHQDAVNQLVFDNGLTLRPLLIAGRYSGLQSYLSTEVALHLKEGVIPEDGNIEIKRNVMHGKNFSVEFEDYLAVICAGLDVKVFFGQGDESPREIHRGQPLDETLRLEWLRKISFSRFQEESIGKYIDQNYHRLKPINKDGIHCGLAAISTMLRREQDFMDMATVGGLATNIHCRGRSPYIGYIDYKAVSARRDNGVEFSASKSAIQNWAEEQLRMLLEANLTPAEQCVAASGFAFFNVDPSPIMRVQVSLESRIEYFDLQAIISLLEKMDVVILKANFMDHADFYSPVFAWPGRALILPFGGGSLYDLAMVSGVPKNQYSVIGCIHRALVVKGKSPRWSIEKNVAPSPLTGMSDAIVVSIKPI